MVAGADSDRDSGRIRRISSSDSGAMTKIRGAGRQNGVPRPSPEQAGCRKFAHFTQGNKG